MSDTLDKLKKQYLKAKNAYYNKDSSGLTDAEYDRLEDKIRKLDPTWPELGKTGVSVKNKKTEVALREVMPSLNKAYPEAIEKWVAKNPAKDYLVTDKLDGSSLQVVYDKGRVVQVVTRGDGVRGGDITFLAPHLSIPKTIKSKSLTIFRCEAVISKSKFEKRWAYEFDNGRNMVNGLLNRKTPHPALGDVDIVVLGCYGLSLRAGLNLAKLEGLEVVTQTGISREQASAEDLTNLLATRLTKSKYEMDGLVVVPYDFNFEYRGSDKPKNAVAFKVNAEADAVLASVKKVIWQISGRERIIPKIEIKPVQIGGVTVTYCTSHNAVWMMDRKIGPGAVVKLVRSGGVIPKIVEVKKPARRMQLPDVPYKTMGVHFVVSNASGETAKVVQVKNTLKFMQTMGIEFLAEKTIRTAYGKLPTPAAYFKAWRAGQLGRILQKVGIGQAMSEKIELEFAKVFDNPVSLLKLMVASQSFGAGIGERKLRQLVDAGLSLAKLSRLSADALETAVSPVKGFSDKTLNLLVGGFAAWRIFYQDFEGLVDVTEERKKKPRAGKWSGHAVSFTGYRDKAQEAEVEAGGGTVVPFGSKTTVLFIKDGGKASSKVAKAKAAGITVAYFDKFNP